MQRLRGSVTVLREGRALPGRLLAEGEEPIPVEDGKTVRGRVDAAKAEQRARPAYKPPPDHPWRRPFKPAAASRRRDSAGVSPRCGFVDESCGPARALRGVWAAGGNALGRVAIDRACRALPTGCPHSRASRPQPHSFSNKFCLLDVSTLEKRGHFNFALTLLPQNVDTFRRRGHYHRQNSARLLGERLRRQAKMLYHA